MTRGKKVIVGLAMIAATAAMGISSSLRAQTVPLGVNASLSTTDYGVAPFHGHPYGFRGFRPFFGGGYHASTFTEGYLRGAAALTVARGQAAFYHSEAWKNQEIARNMFLQNRMFAQEQIRQLRLIREADREREKAKILARNLERKQRRVVEEANEDGPDITSWPKVLHAENFLAHRKQIDGLIELRTQLPNDQAGPVNRALQLALNNLYDDLKADRSTGSWSEIQKREVKSFLNTTYASTRLRKHVKMLS